MLKRLEDFPLATEERLADGEFLGVGGDHLLDRNRLAGSHDARSVNNAEPASRKGLIEAVLSGDHLADGAWQRRIAPLAESLAGRVESAADCVRADVQLLIVFGLRRRCCCRRHELVATV